MKKKFTEPQIVFALLQAERETPVAQIIRKMKISEVTFYRWNKKPFLEEKTGGKNGVASTLSTSSRFKTGPRLNNSRV
jgi:hypothetical protein